MPFCEEIQAARLEEQKGSITKNGASTSSTAKKKKEEPSLIKKLLGLNNNRQLWGGVGIACLDWNCIKPNILGAVTLKTNMLEIWNVESGTIENIIELPRPVHMIRWSPHD